MTLPILIYALMTLTVVALAGAFAVELVRARAPRLRRGIVSSPAAPDGYGARTAGPSRG